MDTVAGRRSARGEGERIVLLDVLRGIAILGTLGTNIWIFTDPNGIIGMLTGDQRSGPVEVVLRFLANGKFLAMLTMLFGVGLEIQRASAARRGRRWPGWYLWRMALLFLDGVLHYVLVVEFDVLMGYAVTGVVVSYLVLTSERAQRRWMLVAGAVHLLLMGLMTSAVSGAGPGKGDPVTIYTDGGYLDQIQFRLQQAGLFRAEAIFTIPLGVTLFLLGARLYRAGAFAADGRGPVLRRRLMVLGLGIGFPLNLATSLSGDLFFVDRYVLPPLVALGYLGLIGWWVHRRPRQGWLAARLAAVGRMALTCYMLQNILASVLCYGWGFGLAAALVDHRPLWTPIAWLGIAVVLVVFSELWQRRFRQGPIEAAWRWAVQAPQRSR
ncbi:uncharacterized protein LX15_002439 [Streptoalloteichus tenebrarius]|uniref:DUF418 domain-containing protein n=2 Tax=Streptoalloteichus tenebrarius (strain ATCC 17920 / DSM 40477 / JCM 4838 / CBS 697.72 / NBRC 16177 / NCIMB 11028 / NRRL B-12390 / A12253. 1 / ISP 5477) TaxID=1933 RepID=A0ABT1HTB4_STRSD|nr:uncharacterized protein [Streptoalloteichus tenebrarius]